MAKYKLHPTFYATCSLLKVDARVLIKQAHEWSEETIAHDELNEFVDMHVYKGVMTAVVWKYCVAILTGTAEPMRYSDDEEDEEAEEEGEGT